MRFRAAALLLALAAVVSATPAHAAEDGELDAVHHTGDGNYWDFSPIGKLELPRLFVTRDADGALGFDAFLTSTRAVASGRYAIDDHGDGEGAHSPAAHAVDPYAEDSIEAEAREAGGDLTVEELAEANAEEILGESTESEGTPYDATLVPTNGGEILVDLSITRHLLFALY